MRINRAYIFSLIFAFACLGGSWGLQHFIIQKHQDPSYVYRPALYLPSSQYARTVSMGYDQAVAGYLFLKMIQAFASSWSLEENPKEMMNYFELISDLDSRYFAAYSFGIMAVGEQHAPLKTVTGEDRGRMVLAIGDKAVLVEPNRYQIPQETGFYAGWSLEDYDTAKYYLSIALRDPECPEHIGRMLSAMYRKEGLFREAFKKYMVDYVDAVQRGDQEFLVNLARRNIVRALNEWYVSEIKKIVVAWHEEHGEYPTIGELRRAGGFQGIVLPDCRAILTSLDQMAAGEMKVPTPEEVLDFVSAVVRPWPGLPVGPHELEQPDYPGFVVWKELGEDDENFVCSIPSAIYRTKKFARKVREGARSDKAGEEGPRDDESRFPLDLYEIMPDLLDIHEPFGGMWIWDPMVGILYPSTYPNAFDTYFRMLE